MKKGFFHPLKKIRDMIEPDMKFLTSQLKNNDGIKGGIFSVDQKNEFDNYLDQTFNSVKIEYVEFKCFFGYSIKLNVNESIKIPSIPYVENGLKVQFKTNESIITMSSNMYDKNILARIPFNKNWKHEAMLIILICDSWFNGKLLDLERKDIF